MGEYAMHRGEKIKIGTCEDMLYLRADQADEVSPLEGNVDPCDSAAQALAEPRNEHQARWFTTIAERIMAGYRTEALAR